VLFDPVAADGELDSLAAELAEVDARQRRIAARVQAVVASGAAGARGLRPRQWLKAYGSCSPEVAEDVLKVASLRARFPEVAAAIDAGRLSHEQSVLLARAVTSVRAPRLAEQLHTLLATAGDGFASFAELVKHWCWIVDHDLQRNPPAVTRNRWTLAKRLDGTSRSSVELDAVATAHDEAALDDFDTGPDAHDRAGGVRMLRERRGDAAAELFANTSPPPTPPPMSPPIDPRPPAAMSTSPRTLGGAIGRAGTAAGPGGSGGRRAGSADPARS
jgi:hypothetical protein